MPSKGLQLPYKQQTEVSKMYARLDPAKLADAQTVASKLADLPKDALLYISGYVKGRCDATEQQKDQPHHSPQMDAQPSA